MVKVGVDGCLEFGLVALIVEFEQLPIFLRVIVPSKVRVVVLISLCVDHFDLVVEKTHCCYLLFQLESALALVELPGLSEVGEENIDYVGVVVQL